MKKLLLILLCLPIIGFGQNVNIPNPIFKAVLVGDIVINTNGDTEIQFWEASQFLGTIFCANLGISDLTGITAFTALTSLECGDNQLSYLDVSQNTDLTTLDCGGNKLTDLDVSTNTALTYLACDSNKLEGLDVSANLDLNDLRCQGNKLISLDVSNNIALAQMECMWNEFTSLDLSNNTALIYLWCSSNQLTSLDLRNGNNTNIELIPTSSAYNIVMTNSPYLNCIDVDDATWSTANWTVANGNIDPQHYFSNNCSGTAIQEHTTNKKLLKVTDLLGRETKQTNQPLFYIYDDGAVEKKIVLD
jgi:hypothetical protein